MARAPARAWTRGSPNLRAWGPPTVGDRRTRDPLKGWTRKDAALTDMLMIQQSAVHVTALRLEFGQVDQTAFHAEVGRVVDHRFDPKGAAFLEVLLGAGVLVADVDGDINAAGDDPGSEDAGRRGQDLPAEDDLDLLRPTEVEVVGNQRFEERASVAGLVEHDRAGDLDLPHRQLPPVPVHPISLAEWHRQAGQPAVEESLDVGRAEPVADRLEPLRVGAGGEPVRQRGPADPGLRGLPFRPLVTVQPDLDRIREVGADLDKPRPEVVVDEVEVVAGPPPVGPVPAEVWRATMPSRCGGGGGLVVG